MFGCEIAAWSGPKPKGNKQTSKAFKAGTYATLEVEVQPPGGQSRRLVLNLISAKSGIGIYWSETTLPVFSAEHVNAFQGLGKGADHARGIWYDEGPDPGSPGSTIMTQGVMISLNRTHKTPAKLKQELTGIAAVEVPASM
jgi:hypothetical protein